MHEPLISAQDVSVRVGDKILLRNVSFDAQPGEVLGLIGPNGAGKSTLLAALSGDIPLDAGRVQIGGLDPTTSSARDMSRVRSVMLQEVSVSFAFLVRDVVEMGRRPWARTDRSAQDDKVVDEALRATEVSHLAERDIMTLSGGERSRVAMSRVLAQQTPVVFLDEPTAALDIRHQELTLGLVRGMAEAGAAVVVVLHDLNAAAAYCDRVLCLANGEMAANGSVREVYTSETLSSIYGWDIDVESSDAGVRILPRRAHTRAATELTSPQKTCQNNKWQ